MPLINCPDCDKEISDAAPACPNCGRPNAVLNEDNYDKEVSAAYSSGGKKTAQKHQEQAGAKNGLNCDKPNADESTEARSVSVLLGIGIILLPFIFAWFTLRKGHTSKAKIISFAWLVLLLTLFNAKDYTGYTEGTKSSSSIATHERVMRVKIMDILLAYINNEVGADDIYKGNVVQFTGKVIGVKKDFSGNSYVTLGEGSNSQGPAIHATFEDSMDYQLGRLRRGEEMTVVCRIDGLMIDVRAKDCVITKSKILY